MIEKNDIKKAIYFMGPFRKEDIQGGDYFGTPFQKYWSRIREGGTIRIYEFDSNWRNIARRGSLNWWFGMLDFLNDPYPYHIDLVFKCYRCNSTLIIRTITEKNRRLSINEIPKRCNRCNLNFD